MTAAPLPDQAPSGLHENRSSPTLTDPDHSGLADALSVTRVAETSSEPSSRNARDSGGSSAGRSRPGRSPQQTAPAGLVAHSLHGYFILEGRPAEPLGLRVTRLRDGRSFATRRVDAVQRGAVIFTLTVSFHRDEEGPEGRVPFPAGTPSPERAVHHPTYFDDFPARESVQVVELLPFRPRAHEHTALGGGTQRRAWIRFRAPLPEDPAAHVRALTCASDISTAFVPVRAAHLDPDPRSLMMTSLDHSLWLHRPVRADEWMLFDMTCTALAGARGLAHGTVHAADGTDGSTFLSHGGSRQGALSVLVP